MQLRDHTRLLAELKEAYSRHAPRSGVLQREAEKVLLDGGSHSLRLIEPFPPRIRSARGARVVDEDGHSILDFWQGHHANILGHNPEVITSSLAEAFHEGFGLQTGFTDRLQIEAAELLCRLSGSEQVRFTTSGSLATMYATLLALAYTGRELVMKVGGGWHGAQPWGLMGLDNHVGSEGFGQVDSTGLPPYFKKEVLVTRFNDADMLEDQFRRYGDQLACFIVEPFIGAGGFMPADREYIQAARRLTHQYGALLILDEVISGFRFRAGSAAAFYGIQPDLATYGKIIGGGMPVAALGGRAEIMALAGRTRGYRIKVSGGTYSAHPASLLAAKTQMSYLAEHEERLYPRLNQLGEKARRTVEEAFAREGIYACCTGYGNNAIPGSSLGMLLFPYREGYRIQSPEDTRNPSVCDLILGSKVLKLSLLLKDIHVHHGLGSICSAHTEEDIETLSRACREVARRLKDNL